jgi:hypothetical protein
MGPLIRDYDHFKKLADDGAFMKKSGKEWKSAAKIASKWDVGWLQLLAWMSRYSTEKELAK